jgi:prepilin-type N-terminal cleavage/methylation domain-containing protein
MKMPRNESIESGFTLLEILVGLFISSLILGGLGLAMGSINRGFEQTTASIDRQGSVTTGLEVFHQDVSRIERVTDNPENPARFLFTGSPLEVVYVLAERPGSNEEGLYWVRLAITKESGGESVLTRMRAPFKRPVPALTAIAWKDEVVLIRGPVDIKLSYRNPRAGLRDWAGLWAAGNMLPEQIRIEVTDTATGRARVPGLTATLKIAAEAGCADANAAGCSMRDNGKLVAAGAQR